MCGSRGSSSGARATATSSGISESVLVESESLVDEGRAADMISPIPGLELLLSSDLSTLFASLEPAWLEPKSGLIVDRGGSIDEP